MDQWRGKVAIVTGTTSGIGKAVATNLVNEGLIVVGLARRKDKADELSKELEGKPGKYHHITADVSKEDDILNAYKWIEENLGPVHILINNAGLLRNTTLINGETNLWKQVFDVNVIGLCMMTREAVKNMQKHKVHGHIVHLNSLSGHRVAYIPTVNVYAASKYAVTALTETLRQELNSIDSKIKISSVSPGVVDTELLEAAGTSDNKNKVISSYDPLKPEDIADAIMYMLSTPPHVQVHDIRMRPLGQST